MTEPKPIPGAEVALYESPDGQIRVDVRLDAETVWLSLNQMAELFERDKSVISRHLRNIFASGELNREATVAKNATVQREGEREVVREVEYFNLDAILSVGYRVNSRRGTQFRIWATRTLRDHLMRGYTLYEQRLRKTGFGDIEQALSLMARTLAQHAWVTEQGQAVMDVIQRYARAWRLLLEFDEDRLAGAPAQPIAPSEALTLAQAREAITQLRGELAARGEASDLFGREHGDQLAGILGAIEQTFNGELLYPSVQARAAHLLYFVIKDHPFTDGNKRIGTLLFLEYLRRNHALTHTQGGLRFANSALVALALLVAESDPAQKSLMIRLILNLLEDGSA